MLEMRIDIEGGREKNKEGDWMMLWGRGGEKRRWLCHHKRQDASAQERGKSALYQAIKAVGLVVGGHIKKREYCQSGFITLLFCVGSG